MEFTFGVFFNVFMQAIGHNHGERIVGTWLFYYSEARYGEEGVSSNDFSNYKSGAKAIPVWVKKGIEKKPGSSLVDRFRRGLRSEYKINDPKTVVVALSELVDNATNIPQDIKDKILSYAKEETLAELLAVIYAFTVTGNLLDLSQEEEEKKSEDAVRLVTYNDLIKLGFDDLQIAKNLVNNDRALYENIPDQVEGSPKQWAQFLSKFPETFSYLYDPKTDKIVGNWSITALTNEQRENAHNGLLFEDTLTIANTKCIFLPGNHTLYVLNFSVNKGFETLENNNLLLTSFISQLVKFARYDVFFPEIYVNVFTPLHEGFWKTLGFREVENNIENRFGKIYRANMGSNFPPQMRGRNGELKGLYEEHFKY